MVKLGIMEEHMTNKEFLLQMLQAETKDVINEHLPVDTIKIPCETAKMGCFNRVFKKIMILY